MKKLKVTAAVLAGVTLALVVVQWPDIRRYLRIKRM
ncbi:DUF6893 family small protein [Microtetraspora fusca]|uniref:DUF6893 family small protein n=1 Tax=Microtetraspora fusca TaxID=1997 RepID=A0ABW6V0M5_MICFU